VPFVDILKVDFQASSTVAQRAIVERYRAFGIRFLAEKIETCEEFDLACQAGYEWFQEYFFARPRVLRATRIPASNMSALRLIRQAQQQAIDFAVIEQIVRHDVAFTHSLLRYLNSAEFCWRAPIESVRHGLLLLGENRIRQWAWMAALPGLGRPKSPALISQALFRGRFCELIGAESGRCLAGADPFLLGIASLFDAILERPLAEVLADLNLSPRMQLALTGPPSDDLFYQMLATVKLYESGQCERIAQAVLGPDMPTMPTLNRLYLTALEWGDSQADLIGSHRRKPARAVFSHVPSPAVHASRGNQTWSRPQ
jgi:EAL and modified HD-GYP domain-containing signal transduction protein